MTHFKVSDEAVEAACAANYYAWSALHQHEREEFRKHMRAALEAALPVMFEAVHQQRDAGGHWGDQDEAVKNWWDGRENAPMFRTVYRIKESK